MAYKPTFKPSPAKRPLRRRLTPLAWALMGVGVLVVMLVIVGGAMSCTGRPTDEPWSPTPTATVSPTVGKTELPPTPTVWYEGMVSPTLGGDSIWWANQMVEDQGHLLPPEEVQDAVWESFIGGLGCGYLADMENAPDQADEERIRQAARFLADDPAVWRVACNGPQSLEDAVANWSPRLVGLVAFGPRNPVICDASPTRCQTGVSGRVVAGLFYHDEMCREMVGQPAPCILRPPQFHSEQGDLMFLGTLEYDEREGGWRIVELESVDFSSSP